MRVFINDEQCALLDRELVNKAPERLVHLIGRQLAPGIVEVTDLVLDVQADTSGIHCRASAEAQERIQEKELASRHGSRYVGIIHSHPRSCPDPSGADVSAGHHTLSLNKHWDTFLIGVVTDKWSNQAGAARVRVGTGQLSLHVADRGAPGSLLPVTALLGNAANPFAGLRARMPELELETAMSRRVAVFGAGSLGSSIAETLVRNGVASVDLFDPDRVEAVNLSRSVFTSRDIGELKVDALAARLRDINPAVATRTFPRRLEAASADVARVVVRGADLVVCVTDDPRAQEILDQLLHDEDTPGLFAGVHAGGHTGELALVVPGLTTCYRCTAGAHRSAALNSLAMDYSTGRHRGSVALGADVTAIATLAAKTALELLTLVYAGGTSLFKPVRDRHTYVLIGLTDDSFNFLPTFDRFPNQHQIQSLWLPAEARGGCHCAPSVQVSIEPVAQPARWRFTWPKFARTAWRASRPAAARAGRAPQRVP